MSIMLLCSCPPSIFEELITSSITFPRQPSQPDNFDRTIVSTSSIGLDESGRRCLIRLGMMPGLVTDDQPVKTRKPTKNEQRRAKKKQQKQHQPDEVVATPLDDGDLDPSLASHFQDVFSKFQNVENPELAVNEPSKPEVFHDDDNDGIQDEEEEAATKEKLSKRAKKKAGKLSIAELKALVRKPEVVEWTDTDASDPRLLISLKSARNVVPVPSHWSLKREYLSSKRGVEKPKWALPTFIAETGISEMRDAVLEKEEEAGLKAKSRARVQPKMGKLDIDYQKLYEAFFRRQTKPQLTRYGEVYYEGKEYETNLRHLRPGELSEELTEALNMTPGGPPPWLINMQKIGVPPSYPALKIPGLNAPPPFGASWGFHPGGYGKPPVKEDGTPEWGGDIFGTGEPFKDDDSKKVEPVDKSVWGELQPFQDEEEEEEEDDEDEDEEEGDEDGEREGVETPFGGTETPGGITSVAPSEMGGTLSMAEEFNLRKNKRGTETDEQPRSAGQVIQERSIRAEGFFGGERAYDLSNHRGAPANIPVLGQEQRGSKRKVGDLDVSVDVDALEREDKLSKDEIRRQYESGRQKEGGWKGAAVDQEDLSQMIAEEAAKRQKRDHERKKGR
nr:pre-mrna-splicing factor [Quercus suber]